MLEPHVPTCLGSKTGRAKAPFGKTRIFTFSVDSNKPAICQLHIFKLWTSCISTLKYGLLLEVVWMPAWKVLPCPLAYACRGLDLHTTASAPKLLPLLVATRVNIWVTL